MNTQTCRVAGFALAAFAVVTGAGCTSDDPAPLYGKVVEKQSLQVGGGEAQTVTLGGKNPVTLLIPADVAPSRVMIEVTLVSDTARRGRFPVNDSGVLVEPQNLTFAAPVRVRQLVPPPPVGRSYVAVVVPDGGNSFVAKGRARLIAAATAENPGLQLWEGDGTGSGLWGLAVSEAGDAPTDTVDAGSATDGLAP